MIANKLQGMIGEAMKAHDEVRLSTLRLLFSAFNYEKIDKQHELTDEEELVVIRREAKKRKEGADAYEKAGSKDRAELELKELAILQEFLPPELTDSDLEKFVDEAIAETKATGISDMGKVIGLVKEKSSGNADGGKVAQLVRAKLNG
jgi:uncharacterized protein